MQPARPVTSRQLRRISGDALLRVLRHGGVTTASELMDLTGLSRTAVHEVCGDLLRLGWIEEVGPDAPGPGPARPAANRGRPPRRYLFAARAGAIVSIDLGVNTVTVHVADLRGRTLAVAQRHFDDPASVDRAQVLDELADRALTTCGVDPSKVLIVAAGVPMPVSPSRSIYYPPDQRVIRVVRDWADRRGWSILIENDANLAALGERWDGVAKGLDNVIVLLAGERMGAGIIMDGRLVRGEHFSSGELRFVSLMPTVQPEFLGIGKHTRQLAHQALTEGWATSGMRELVEQANGSLSAGNVFRFAEAGDESAGRIVRIVCERLAQLIGVLATLLDPAMVVISGGLADAGEFLATTTQSLLPEGMIDNPPQIAVSRQGMEPVIVGGISLALDYLDGHLLDGHGLSGSV